MKIPRSVFVLGLGIAAAGILLFANSRDRAARVTESAPPVTVKQDSISAGSLTLASTLKVLPDDNDSYPPGPHADVVNNNCLACHSASMALYQPSLSAAEWRKEVEKMRDAYGAPIAEADIPVIVEYLVAMRESHVK
jgi:cytochrome c5